MGSAYNSAQTIQGEGGDFNIVNTYLLNVYNEATLDGTVTFTSDVTFESDGAPIENTFSNHSPSDD